MNYDLVFQDFKSLPVELQREVLDFINFLKSKQETPSAADAREFGYAKGKINIHPDFDELPEDFKEYLK